MPRYVIELTFVRCTFPQNYIFKLFLHGGCVTASTFCILMWEEGIATKPQLYLLYGRPYGGTAIFLRKTLNCTITNCETD